MVRHTPRAKPRALTSQIPRIHKVTAANLELIVHFPFITEDLFTDTDAKGFNPI